MSLECDHVLGNERADERYLMCLVNRDNTTVHTDIDRGGDEKPGVYYGDHACSTSRHWCAAWVRAEELVCASTGLHHAHT
jgi:hypothetical protein